MISAISAFLVSLVPCPRAPVPSIVRRWRCSESSIACFIAAGPWRHSVGWDNGCTFPRDWDLFFLPCCFGAVSSASLSPPQCQRLVLRVELLFEGFWTGARGCNSVWSMHHPEGCLHAMRLYSRRKMRGIHRSIRCKAPRLDLDAARNLSRMRSLASSACGLVTAFLLHSFWLMAEPKARQETLDTFLEATRGALCEFVCGRGLNVFG